MYFGSHDHSPEVTEADFDQVTETHHEFLCSYLGSSEKAIFYSYTKHVNGFAAILEEEEAANIAKPPTIVRVFLNKGTKLQTTPSWEFMLMDDNGLIHPSSLFEKARFGEDTIIGQLNTGNFASYCLFLHYGNFVYFLLWVQKIIDASKFGFAM
ncbi:PREDICTED: subtilisin-like protease SBT5.4 [Lupinus angustifolius]|uniref:subtilisin-like protease SBT5.4 n=1 Tax=Lupinus angustifolius TaxID=3871 RepID=UPI00092EBA90|nr:PREDICTED: subtilisin-like protease SBT5.4 [Lupinus angustifolius]